MKLEVVSVFDRALQAFGRPVFVQTTGQAIRSFMDECSDEKSEIAKHPEDYELFHLGSWDDGTGRWMQFEKPELLIQAKAANRKGLRNVS